MAPRLDIVRLKHPQFKGPLRLARTPRFLRFTLADGKWDALDQLDDEPGETEVVMAAELKQRGSILVDGTRKGRRCGWTEHTADYELVPSPPTQEVLRSTERWRAWCEAEARKEKKS
jgi:hypothetical protein